MPGQFYYRVRTPETELQFNKNTNFRPLTSSRRFSYVSSEVKEGLNVRTFLKYANIRELAGLVQNSPCLIFKKKDGIKFFYAGREQFLKSKNLFLKIKTVYRVKQEVLNSVNKNPFNINVVVWLDNFLVRFLQNTTGLKTTILFNPFLESFLSFTERAQCSVWVSRIIGFQRLVGSRFFLLESLKVSYLALKIKDPKFLSE